MGFFFLGLPISKDGSSYIEFNARRIYGKERLALILKDWKILKEYKNYGDTFDDILYVLEKKKPC